MPETVDSQMQAAVFHRCGEPGDVVEIQTIPIAQPGRGEVRVRMLASPVNPSDLMYIRGRYGIQPKLPATPGFEGVGVVESAGSGLWGKWLLGKRVAVLNRNTGNWSSRTVLPAKQVIPLSANLSVEQSATFFVNPATSLIITRKLLRIPSGAWLLQTAAGSAVGRMVIRLGRRCGFRTLNVVRRSEQAEELRQLGADATVVFDPATQSAESLRQDVLRITQNQGVPFAMDCVGGATGSAVVACLATGGRLIVFGTLDEKPLMFSSRELMQRSATVEGFWLAAWMDRQKLVAKLKLVRMINSLLREGVLDSEIAATFPLAAVGEAVRRAEQPARSGKVLLRINQE